VNKHLSSKLSIAVLLIIANTTIPAFSDDDIRRERNPHEKELNSLLDSLEGKKPPKIDDATGWMNTANGKPLTWEDLKGKVVLIDFWGVWCDPCRDAIPHIKQLYEKRAAEGLVVLGIHTKFSQEEGPQYVREQNMPYPIAFDRQGEIILRYHVESFPGYYLIDHRGTLRMADIKNQQVDKAVDLLLSERNKPDKKRKSRKQ
jgi:thiol-disulfide isomerase/thioredoxin